MSYLWHGVHDNNKSRYIAWDDVCKPKKTCGLGLTRIIEWNHAAMGKNVYVISAKKENLWVKWIYMKDQNSWEYKDPADSSWYQEKVDEFN